MAVDSGAAPDLADAFRGLTKVWWLLVLAGLLGIAAGIIVLVVPSIGLVTLAVVSGIFLLLDGIMEIAASIGTAIEHRGMLAITGVITAVVGVLLVRHPISGVVAIALLLGFWLLTLGIVRLFDAFSAENRLWALILSAIEIVAGIVIVASPGIGVATLAILVGISFILRGLALAGVGWTLRKLRAA
jgi:uncharacterized membrane protein HdeD (DUF308 family)